MQDHPWQSIGANDTVKEERCYFFGGELPLPHKTRLQFHHFGELVDTGIDSIEPP